MSYRAFKRLLGETSLERKCHLLFGTATVVLIMASFWLYAFRTERLAYEQTMPMGRLLVNWLITKQHLQHLQIKKWEWDKIVQDDEGPSEKPQSLSSKDWKKLWLALDDLSEKHLPEAFQKYQESIIK